MDRSGLGTVELDEVVEQPFTVLEAARQIYEFHLGLRPDVTQQPRGVVIHPQTLRGDLIFSDYPVLLPNELFIPMAELER